LRLCSHREESDCQKETEWWHLRRGKEKVGGCQKLVGLMWDGSKGEQCVGHRETNIHVGRHERRLDDHQPLRLE